MLTKTGSIHLEIQTSRKSPVGIIRTSYRENGKIKHKQFGRIAGCTLQQLKLLQLAFAEKVIPEDSKNSFKIIGSKEYGASLSLLRFAKKLQLDKAIYSRPSEDWVKDILAMIIGRVIYAGSKLSLCNQYTNTCLWELLGHTSRPDVERHCYFPLDKLLKRQRQIQTNLAKKHSLDTHLVLYDITSSYFEGAYKDSEIVKFGYNRDCKKGHEQIVIGLVCTSEGCPIGIEVYPGNTKDSCTVIDKINEIRSNYTIKKVVFVGDRGMITSSNREALKDDEDLHTITALTHPEIKDLLNRKIIQLNLFDEKNIHEVIDPQESGRRYILCKNPVTGERETKTRNSLLELTQKGLGVISDYKRSTTVEKLGARVGKVLGKYKVAKFIKWEIKADNEPISRNHRLVWTFDNDKIKAEKRFDGCYIITTDIDKESLNEIEVVKSYKSLGLVEQAFRNLKTVQLEIRPTYHKKDDRIRAHVFLCMLSYYLQWHIQQKLKPLFSLNGSGKHRRWTFKNVIETLSKITKNKIVLNGVEFYRTSEPSEEQRMVLDLMDIEL